MEGRRLEDRIREMCRKALHAQSSELDSVFTELKSALHEHALRLRGVAARKLTTKKAQPPERRSA